MFLVPPDMRDFLTVAEAGTGEVLASSLFQNRIGLIGGCTDGAVMANMTPQERRLTLLQGLVKQVINTFSSIELPH